MAGNSLEKLKEKHKLDLKVSENEKPKNWLVGFLVHILYFKQKQKYKAKVRVNKITVISILVALLFFSINISLSGYRSLNNASSGSPGLMQKMYKVLNTLKNGQNLENSMQEVNQTLLYLQEQLKSIDEKLWPILSVRDLVSESWALQQKWLISVSNLAQFKISKDGLTSNLPKNFTQYLEVFFDELPNLIRKSQDFVDRIRGLLGWSFWIPNINVTKIKQALSLSDDVLDLIRSVYQNRLGILELLGYQTLHKILIFNQNPGESRPTGGFLGSFLSLNVSQGRFDIGKSQSIYLLEEDQSKAFMSFPANWYYDLQYGRYATHGIRNLNYFSCFPDSAKIIEKEFSQSKKGQNADSILFITPNLIKNLFSEKTELRVDLSQFLNEGDKNSFQKEIVLTKDNFYDQIERLTAIDFNDPNNPKSAITTVLLALFFNLNTILKDQDPFAQVVDWLKSGYTRDIQIWSKNENLENFWMFLNFAGTQTCQNISENSSNCKNVWIKLSNQVCPNHKNSQTLAFLQANLSSDKRDIFALQSFNFNFKPDGYGKFDAELKYTRSYKNLDKLQRRFNSRNGVTFLAFQLPENASNYSLSSDQSYKTPFIRPFYTLKIKEQENKEIYTPESIQKTIDSSYDITNSSFTYKQPDQSTVIGTYINEEDVSNLVLKFKIDQSKLVFFPAPASNNNTISVGNTGNIINLTDLNNTSTKLSNSNGEGVILNYK